MRGFRVLGAAGERGRRRGEKLLRVPTESEIDLRANLSRQPGLGIRVKTRFRVYPKKQKKKKRKKISFADFSFLRELI